MFKTGKVRPQDASDYAIQSSRDILEDIRLKLYAQCGDLDPNVLKVDICGVSTVFQPKDCAGTNIGTPQKALQVVALNKQIVQICNVQELAQAITLPGGGVTYNTPEFKILQNDDFLLIPANTIHSVSYKVTAGTSSGVGGSISIDGATAIDITVGESDTWTATTMLNKSFRFQALNGTIKIAIIKP